MCIEFQTFVKDQWRAKSKIEGRVRLQRALERARLHSEKLRGWKSKKIKI